MILCSLLKTCSSLFLTAFLNHWQEMVLAVYQPDTCEEMVENPEINIFRNGALLLIKCLC